MATLLLPASTRARTVQASADTASGHGQPHLSSERLPNQPLLRALVPTR